MHARRAQRRDAFDVERLYRLLVPGDENIAVHPDRVAALESDATNQLLVVEVDGVVAGTAFLTLCLDSMYGLQPYGVVENLIVLPERRGQGVGAALMQELERIARAAHCTKLMLLSSQSRSAAHAFFLGQGFDGERKRAFVKYLNRDPQRPVV